MKNEKGGLRKHIYISAIALNSTNFFCVSNPVIQTRDQCIFCLYILVCCKFLCFYAL